MSSYTMPLRAIVEHYSQDQEGLSYQERMEIARPHLFNFSYPIFDEAYKKVFETNFMKFFYTREIGFETEGLFKLKLDTWLNLNMGYYNKLFESELIEFDPLTNTKMDTTYNKQNDMNQGDSRNITSDNTTTGNSDSESNTVASSDSNSNNFNRELESDTPDNRLAITTENGEGVIEYASNIQENKGTQSTTNNGDSTTTSNDTTTANSNSNIDESLTRTINNIEDYVQNKVGKTGTQSYSKMLQEYRQTFLRIERMIFDEMQELFMGVY